ncbi:hypothetical protein GCM10025777_48140 [Membranihabitans marinus]|uniref:Uncharacterized protein n=1 Tax=Nesterenkonia rhizosphaerae TaxID=1348272 RepID=A0ABP9FUS8_9MICC
MSVDGAAASASFGRMARLLSAAPLTSTISELERELNGADRDEACRILGDTEFSAALIEDALTVRERVGVIDTLIHAAAIAQVLPRVLEPGEVVTKRPSLGAGNDPGRAYDLETSLRVAEFKLASWKGRDSMRQRGLFADVVGLSMDTTGRRRQVYVVGERPVRFLGHSLRNAKKTVAKAALRVREWPGLTENITVSEYTRQAGVEVIDLRDLLPDLR